MALRTLIDIANNVAIELRFETFQTLIGEDGKNQKTILLAIRQATLRDLLWHHPWSVLRRDFSISFTRNRQYYDLPPDFDHIVNDTAWDLVRDCPAMGPLDPPDWATVTNADALVTEQIAFMIRGKLRDAFIPVPGATNVYRKAVYVWPIPSDDSSGEALKFEYISNEIVRGADGKAKQDYTADDDLPIFDADLVEHAAYVRALRLLGLNFSDEMDELQKSLKVVSRRDGGAQTKSISGGHLSVFYPNTPGHVPVRRRRY